MPKYSKINISNYKPKEQISLQATYELFSTTIGFLERNNLEYQYRMEVPRKSDCKIC